jgi:hypothetical protein
MSRGDWRRKKELKMNKIDLSKRSVTDKDLSKRSLLNITLTKKIKSERSMKKLSLSMKKLSLS